MKTKRNYIEKKLRRMTGMSSEARLNVQHAMAHTPWRAKCRNCGHWSIADYEQILKINCVNCDQPLGRRT